VGLRVPFDEDAVALAVLLAALEGGLALVDDADAEAEGPAAVMVSRGRGGLKGRRRRFWVPCRSGGIFIECLITGSSYYFPGNMCILCDRKPGLRHAEAEDTSRGRDARSRGS
jgi:hypothetical protein